MLPARISKFEEFAMNRSKSSAEAPNGLFHCKVTSSEQKGGITTVLPMSIVPDR